MEPKNAKRRSNFRRANRIMPRRRIDIATEAIDYKNPDLLKKFVTESGKILPRRVTGMPAHLHQENHSRDQTRSLGSLDEIEGHSRKGSEATGFRRLLRFGCSVLG